MNNTLRVLIGEIPIEQAIFKTGIDNVSFIKYTFVGHQVDCWMLRARNSLKKALQPVKTISIYSSIARSLGVLTLNSLWLPIR